MPKQPKFEINTAAYRYLYRCLLEDDFDELTRAGLTKSQYYVLESESYFTGSMKFSQEPALKAAVRINWPKAVSEVKPQSPSLPIDARCLRLRYFVLEAAKIYRQLLNNWDYEQLYEQGAKYRDVQFIVSRIPTCIQPSVSDVSIRLRHNTTRSLRMRETIRENLGNSVDILHFVRNHGTGRMLNDLFGLDQHDYRNARKICERTRRGRFKPLGVEQQQRVDRLLMLACYSGNGISGTFRMPTRKDYMRFSSEEPNTPYWAYYDRASKFYDHFKQR